MHCAQSTNESQCHLVNKLTVSRTVGSLETGNFPTEWILQSFRRYLVGVFSRSKNARHMAMGSGSRLNLAIEGLMDWETCIITQ